MKTKRLLPVLLIVSMLFGISGSFSAQQVLAGSSPLIFENFGSYTSSTVPEGWLTTKDIVSSYASFKGVQTDNVHGTAISVKNNFVGHDNIDMYYQFDQPFETGSGSGYLAISYDLMIPCSPSTEIGQYSFYAGFLPSDEWMQQRWGGTYSTPSYRSVVSMGDESKPYKIYTPGWLTFYKAFEIKSGAFGHHANDNSEMSLISGTWNEYNTAQKNIWYSVDTVVNLNNRTVTTYIDGISYAQNIPFGRGEGAGYGAFPIENIGFRLLGPKNANGESIGNVEFYLDNIYVNHSLINPTVANEIHVARADGTDTMEGSVLRLAFSEYIGNGSLLASGFNLEKTTGGGSAVVTAALASGKSVLLNLSGFEHGSSYLLSFGSEVTGGVSTAPVSETLTFSVSEKTVETFGGYNPQTPAFLDYIGWKTSRETDSAFTGVDFGTARGNALSAKCTTTADKTDLYYQFETPYPTGEGSGYLAVSYDVMIPGSENTVISDYTFCTGLMIPDSWMKARWGTNYNANEHKGLEVKSTDSTNRFVYAPGYKAFYKTFNIKGGNYGYRADGASETNFIYESAQTVGGNAEKGVWYTVNTFVDLNTRKITAYVNGEKYINEVLFGRDGGTTGGVNYTSIPIDGLGFYLQSSNTARNIQFYIDNLSVNHSYSNPMTEGYIAAFAGNGSALSLSDNHIDVAFSEYVNLDDFITSDFSLTDTKTNSTIPVNGVTFDGRNARIAITQDLDYGEEYRLAISSEIFSSIGTKQGFGNSLLFSTPSAFALTEFSLSKGVQPVNLSVLEDDDVVTLHVKGYMYDETPRELILIYGEYTTDSGVYRLIHSAAEKILLSVSDTGVFEKTISITIQNASNIDQIKGFIWDSQSLYPLKDSVYATR